jgi:tetratricopeptide (TPR) repeat protein
MPSGEAIDRAVRLSGGQDCTATQTDDGAGVHAEQRRGVLIDELTAGLLDERFEVGADISGSGLELRGVRAPTETTAGRTLLGRATPCVARDAELASLEATFRACVDDGVARVVLVTAPAGAGKSRVRRELSQRLRAGGARFELIEARGDPLAAGTPFAMLGAAIRRASGVVDGEPVAVAQKRLRARLSRHFDARAQAPFIGELAGIPFADADDVELRAARQDPRLMADQIRRAIGAWLAAECAVQPVILVLEDLHWGDLPTVALVEHVLRALEEKPLFVLALARPEVRDAFPELWASRDVHELRLCPLSRKASEKLARAVLGTAAANDVVDRLCAQAAGNAFYLEELLRAEVEGKTGALPDTVLAMVQARLGAMEPPVRQLLRAASVFGRTFWPSGVRALHHDNDLPHWLAELERREVIAERKQSRVQGEPEYQFRHDLVRDAAYAMLTDDDRALGHRLAAAWLEQVGERDPSVLAEHFERGGAREEAATFWTRAAESALVASDFGGALRHASRGLGCGAHGERLGALRLVEAEAHGWRGAFADAERAAFDAMRWLPVGTARWCAAVGEAANAAGVQGSTEPLAELARALDDVDPRAPSALLAATRLAEHLVITGQSGVADTVLARFSSLAGSLERDEPALAARLSSARALRALFAGNAGEHLVLVDEAVARFRRAGDLRNACVKHERAGYARLEIGDYAGAERILREALSTAQALGLANVASTAQHNLGLTLARRGLFDEALDVEGAAAASFHRSGNRRMEGASREYLAFIRLWSGDAAGAEREALCALEVARAEPPLPLNEAESLAIYAQTLLAQGRVDEAHKAAHEALLILEALGGIDDGESLIRLTWAEALLAKGEPARAALLSARTRLLGRAARITDPSMRASFLENVPENARTLALSASMASSS